LVFADGGDAGVFEAGDRDWQPGDLLYAEAGRMRIKAMTPLERVQEFVDAAIDGVWEVEYVSNEELIGAIARNALASVEVERPARYLIDSNIYDKIADDADALTLAEQLVGDGRLELLSTHVQLDELTKIKDDDRLGQLLRVPARTVPTFGFVFGVSRLGMARLSGEQPLEDLRGENRDKYTHDGLIAATAQYEGATLVTEDVTIARRAQAQGIPVCDWATLRAHVERLAKEQAC
jgi:hypothetical protein